MKKIFILFSLFVICLVVAAQNPCPQVIPALQQWKGAKGTLNLPTQGSIVINPSDEEALVVGDMKYDIEMGRRAGTRTCGVTYGNGSPQDLREAGADFMVDDFEKIFTLV